MEFFICFQEGQSKKVYYQLVVPLPLHKRVLTAPHDSIMAKHSSVGRMS